jgi:hypothetical protein
MVQTPCFSLSIIHGKPEGSNLLHKLFAFACFNMVYAYVVVSTNNLRLNFNVLYIKNLVLVMFPRHLSIWFGRKGSISTIAYSSHCPIARCGYEPQ